MFLIKNKDIITLPYYEEETSYVFLHIFRHLHNWLPVDVALDPEKQYLKYNHPLWIYFNNSYSKEICEWTPMIISPNIDECYIPINNFQLGIATVDFEKVKKFCSTYYHTLKSLAEQKFDIFEFFDFMRDARILNEPAKIIISNKDILSIKDYVIDREEHNGEIKILKNNEGKYNILDCNRIISPEWVDNIMFIKKYKDTYQVAITLNYQMGYLYMNGEIHLFDE